MKYIFSFLSILFFDIAQAQNVEVYQTDTTNSPCTTTIKLYSDNNFFYESCGSSSRISFGKWVQKKDTIKLEPVNPKLFAVVKSVEATTIAGDSIWLVILDRDGNNMTAKISTGLEVAGRGSYLFSIDSGGNKKFVYKRSGSKIVFRTLNKLFGQHIEIPVDTANHFVITLNISSDWINSTHADWGETTSVSLLKKGDRLITTKTPKQTFQKKS